MTLKNGLGKNLARLTSGEHRDSLCALHSLSTEGVGALVRLEEGQKQRQEEVVGCSESLVPYQVLWEGQEHLCDGCLASSHGLGGPLEQAHLGDGCFGSVSSPGLGEWRDQGLKG